MARKLSYQERRFRVTRLFVGFVSFLVNHLAFSFVVPAFKRRWQREGMDTTSDEFGNRWSDFTDRWVFADLVAARLLRGDVPRQEHDPAELARLPLRRAVHHRDPRGAAQDRPHRPFRRGRHGAAPLHDHGHPALHRVPAVQQPRDDAVVRVPHDLPDGGWARARRSRTRSSSRRTCSGASPSTPTARWRCLTCRATGPPTSHFSRPCRAWS